MSNSRKAYAISVPCAATRHKSLHTLYLEGEDGKVIARVCPVCTKTWTEIELKDINDQMAALESNWKDYEYPAGARGHFTGD